MKTKIILVLVLVLVLDAFKSRAQISPVDLTTPHAVGGGTITGDPLVTAFGKLNTSISWLKNYCDTNSATNTALAFQLGTLNTNLLSTSNLVNGALAQFAAFPVFTNWFYPDYNFNVTNLNARVGAALSSYILTLTNTLNIATISNLLINLPGAFIQNGTINSNKFDADTLAMLGAGGGGGGGGTMNFDSGAITSDGSGNITAGTLNLAGGSLTTSGSGDIIGNTYQSINFGGGSGNGAELDTTANFFMGSGFSSGNHWLFYMQDTFGTYYRGFSVGWDDSAPDPAYAFMVGMQSQGIFTANSTLDDGVGDATFLGDVTANTFNPVSDRARKENIKPFDPQSALQMVLALTNYTWRFKAVTNYVAKVTRLTNSVAANGVSLTTNLVAKIRPATGKEFGPMAQDWHQVTGLGGGTNISITSMNGLLLGALQGLSQKLAGDELHVQIPFYTPPGSISTTFGYGPGLLACDAKNLYVSVGTNAWCRFNLPTNTW